MRCLFLLAAVSDTAAGIIGYWDETTAAVGIQNEKPEASVASSGAHPTTRLHEPLLLGFADHNSQTRCTTLIHDISCFHTTLTQRVTRHSFGVTAGAASCNRVPAHPTRYRIHSLDLYASIMIRNVRMRSSVDFISCESSFARGSLGSATIHPQLL